MGDQARGAQHCPFHGSLSLLPSAPRPGLVAALRRQRSVSLPKGLTADPLKWNDLSLAPSQVFELGG